MKVSFDLDGTIWDHVDFFKDLMRSLQASGHEIGILTGHRQSSAEKDINKLLEAGFPKPDFYYGRTEEYMHLNGAHYKTMIIERENIAMHFDDYDYNNPDTCHLFPRLGQEFRVCRVRSKREMSERVSG